MELTRAAYAATGAHCRLVISAGIFEVLERIFEGFRNGIL